MFPAIVIRFYSVIMQFLLLFLSNLYISCVVSCLEFACCMESLDINFMKNYTNTQINRANKLWPNPDKSAVLLMGCFVQ